MNDQHDDEEDIILSELPDDELVEQMYDDLYDGLADEIAEGTQILLDRGWEAARVLDEALVAGMTIVGADFRDGILFVPEVLMAANAMKAGMAILKPILADTGAKPVGKMVIGTVKGDIHDIGKNLVGMPYMKVVIDTLKEQGIRDDYIVMVGGAPLNEEFGAAIGADAYCRDAATAVEKARELVGSAS
jgi:methanogenic corrinoid protein MtbC1